MLPLQATTQPDWSSHCEQYGKHVAQYLQETLAPSVVTGKVARSRDEVYFTHNGHPCRIRVQVKLGQLTATLHCYGHSRIASVEDPQLVNLFVVKVHETLLDMDSIHDK